MNVEKIYEQIEQEWKRGTLDICIHCNKESKYYPNPMYMHECKECGHDGYQKDVRFSYPKERIMEILKKEIKRESRRPKRVN